MTVRLPLAALLVAALIAGAFSVGGCSTDKDNPAAGKKRIIILTNGNSPFWDACRVGLQDAERELKLGESGLTAILEVNNGTSAGSLEKLRQFEAQSDIAAVGISAVDADNAAVAAQLKQMQAKGIHIVCIDSDVDRAKFRDARFAFIGTDNLLGGRELGKCAKLLRPEGGPFVTFVGRTGAQNAVERVGGFAEGAGAAFKAMDNMGDDLDRSRARQNVRDAIKNHPGLNTLVGIWSYNAPAIVDVACVELKRRKDFTIVTFDAEPAALPAMAAGNIDAMIVQNPHKMGYEGVRLMKALYLKDEKTVKEMFPNHGKTDGDLFDTGLKVVVPDAGSPLKPEAFDKRTQYLKLSEFQAWLTKNNLTGS